MVRIFPGNARVRGNSSLIPGSGRFPAEGNGNHSNILAWEIPCTKKPGRLQSMGLPKFESDLVTKQQQQKML